jgi:hypothetical protein
MNNDLSIVIRSVGERTTDASRALLEAACPGAPLTVINETPFSRAIRKGFETGIEMQRRWTLVMDADVLVRAAFIEEATAYMRELDDGVFVLQGLVFDKIFNLLRPAGNHLYSTSLLKTALDGIPEEGDSIRPESSTIDRMVELGHPFIQRDLFAGLHDYEQNYIDIAKKCFVQAHKHGVFVDEVWPQWETRKKNDPDFEAAILGVEAGKAMQDTVYIDNRFLEERIIEFHGKDRFASKPPLAEDQYDDDTVRLVLQEALSTPERAHMQAFMFPPDRWNHVYSNR